MDAFKKYLEYEEIDLGGYFKNLLMGVEENVVHAVQNNDDFQDKVVNVFEKRVDIVMGKVPYNKDVAKLYPNIKSDFTMAIVSMLMTK